MPLNNSDIIQSLINGTTPDATIIPSPSESLQQTKANRVTKLLTAKQTNVQAAKASILDQVLERKFAPKVEPIQPAGLSPDEQLILARQAEDHRNQLINAPQALSPDEQWQQTLNTPPQPSSEEVSAFGSLTNSVKDAFSNFDPTNFAKSVREGAAATAATVPATANEATKSQLLDAIRIAEGGDAASVPYGQTEYFKTRLANGENIPEAEARAAASNMLTRHIKLWEANKGRAVVNAEARGLLNANPTKAKAIQNNQFSSEFLKWYGEIYAPSAISNTTLSANEQALNPNWVTNVTNNLTQGAIPSSSTPDQTEFTVPSPVDTPPISETGRRLAKVFEDAEIKRNKENQTSLTGSPSQRLAAADAAEQAKKDMTGPTIQGKVKEFLSKGSTRAGELYADVLKQSDEYQRKQLEKEQPQQRIAPRRSFRESYVTDTGFDDPGTSTFDDSPDGSFEDPGTEFFEGPTFDTDAKEEFHNQDTGVIKYANGSWGYQDPVTGKTVAGLNRIAAESYAIYALTDTKAKIAGAPEPGTAGHVFNKTTGAFGPTAATLAKGIRRIVGGPITLSQLADSNDISYEDTQLYRTVNTATTLTTEQQAFKDSDTYKTLAKLDKEVTSNIETNALIDEFAANWKKQFPTNERNAKGAVKAFHLIAETDGTIAAVMNALKEDKASLADMGWESVPYTLALTIGNIPVQLALFTDLAIGMSEEAIEEWKAGHDGQEPSPEIAQEIMALSAVRLAAEKASAGVLRTFLGKIPGLGGPKRWAPKVNEAVTKTTSPEVKGLKTFSQKYIGGPAKKVGQAGLSILKVPLIEGGQEAFDEWLSGVQQENGDFLSISRWTPDSSKVSFGFLAGAFGVATTGAGVKVFDIAAKTATTAAKAFTTDSQIKEFNTKTEQAYKDSINEKDKILQKIEKYNNTDPKVIKDFETVEQELLDLAALGGETATIENGKVVTNSAYIKEQFLVYDLQIKQGLITPEQVLQEIYNKIDSDTQVKLDLYDNLKAQIPETIPFGQTAPGQFDQAKLKKVQADIEKIEIDPDLSDEDKNLKTSDLREEEQRLFTKLDSPANADILAIYAEEKQAEKEALEKELKGRKWEITTVKKGFLRKKTDFKGVLEKEGLLKAETEEKPDNSINEKDFTNNLEELKGLADGSMTLTMGPSISSVTEGVETPTSDVEYANIDPSGRFKVGDIVQIDSQDADILASQGFKIDYFLAEQERDGKVHVKLKGRSETIPIDKLYEVARPKTTDKTPLTFEEQVVELAKRDLTDDQRNQFKEFLQKHIESRGASVAQAGKVLGSSADSFENISNEEINPTSSLEEKSKNTELPEVARRFYAAEINRRKIQAARAANEQLAPNEKSLGIVKGEILEGQSTQWKGLYTYYQELVDAYSTLKDDTVLRDQQIKAIRSNMSTHSANLNRKLAAFQTAQTTIAPQGNAVAVIGSRVDKDTRDMQYDVVTNMTADQIETARNDGQFVTNIGPQSTALVNALAAEVEYGNHIMGVVEGYANTPMAAKAASKKEQLKRDQDVLNRLIKLYANQPQNRKEMTADDIASIGVSSPTGDKKGPTLQEQLKTAITRANEITKIPKEERSEEDANELQELQSEIGAITLQISQEGAESESGKSTGKDKKSKGKNTTSKKSPPPSNETPTDVRVRAVIKRNIKEAVITVKDSKIVKTFIDGAKETYNYVVGDSLDEVFGLAGTFFSDLVQIGSSEKLIKGINTLQDTDFNNDATLKEALIDLGIKEDSADILITRYNDFQGRYDQVINRDIQKKDKVYWINDPDEKETIYQVEEYFLTTDAEGKFDKNGKYTKLVGGKVVLRSELMSADIHALHKPLEPLLRKDEFDPDNVHGRLPDQVVFTLMLNAMTFKQQTPNNNRWGDKAFAQEAFLFGGKNQSLMPDEQAQVDQISHGFHESAARMGVNAIQLLELSGKTMPENSGINQAGADLYFDHLGPALGMMAITIADGDSQYFDVNKHIWDFNEDTKDDRIYNNAPEGSTIGYKHLTVRDKTYPNKKVRKALADIIEVSGTDITISSGPLQAPAKIPKRIKNTFSKIGEGGEVFKALTDLHNVVWRKNKAMDAVTDLRDHLSTLYALADVQDRFVLEQVTENGITRKVAVKDKKGNKIPLHHKDTMMSLESSNKNKTNTIDALIAADDLEELDNFHIAYELQNHHRLMQTGSINPQQSKVTRFLVDGWEAQDYTADNLWQFKVAVAYNFGIKTDNQYNFNNEFDFDEKITKTKSVLDAVYYLQQLNSAKATLKDANKESAKAKKATDAVKLATSQFASALRDVKRDFPDGNMSLLRGVTALAEYMVLKQDKRHKRSFNYAIQRRPTFSSGIAYEIDGMSNGWAMNVAQFPMWEGEELWKKMKQVGNYPGKPGSVPFHDIKTSGPYDDLAEKVKKGTTLDIAWKYYYQNHKKQSYSDLAPSYMPEKKKDGKTKREVFNEKFAEIDAALTALYPDFKDSDSLRDVVKYPFIMKMYGGGIKRISNDVTTDIIKDLNKQITEVQNIYSELKKATPDSKITEDLNKLGINTRSEYFETKVQNLANNLELLGAFEPNKRIKGGVTTKQDFLEQMKQDKYIDGSSTALNANLNTAKLHAVISTTVAPRFKHGLDTLLEATKEPRDAIVEMGEVLHEVFIAHYEKAYKEKLEEVNKEIEVKRFLAGDKSKKAPKLTSLTKLQIRELIEDTNGELIEVFPQFKGPLSRLDFNDNLEGFVDLSDTRLIRDTGRTENFDEQQSDQTPRITNEEVVVDFNNPKTTDKLNTVRTTASQLEFIRPGVATLIREIINMDASILTSTIANTKSPTNKFILPTHDGGTSTPENVTTFAVDYNGYYKEYNTEYSLIAITLNQVVEALETTEKNGLTQIVADRFFKNSFNNKNLSPKQKPKTLAQRMAFLKAVTARVVKQQSFIKDRSTGQFVSAQMHVLHSPATEKLNLAKNIYENILNTEVQESVDNAPQKESPPAKTIAKDFMERVSNKQIDDLVEDGENDNTLDGVNDFKRSLAGVDADIQTSKDKGDITRNNFRDTFDRMTALSSKYYSTKEEQDAHTQTLSNILNKLSDGFESTSNLQLTQDEIIGVTQGKYEEALERMTIQISQGGPTTRNGQSPQEVYVHEMLHAMTSLAIDEYPLVSGRIDKLYDEVLASLDKTYGKGKGYKVFLPAGTNPANLSSKAEQAMARKQYDYVFQGKEENRLHEFLAYAATNQNLIAHMKKTPRPGKTTLLDRILEGVQAVVDAIRTMFGNKVYRAASSSSFAEAIAITEHLVSIQNKHKSKDKQLGTKTYLALDAADEIIQDFANRVGKNILEKTVSPNNTIPFSNIATGVVNAPFIALSNDAGAVAMRQSIDQILNKTLRGIAHEVGGGALTPQLKEQLLQSKINISKQRQEAETFYTNWFKNIWKSIPPKDMDDHGMSFETREALTSVLLQTDLSSLKLANLGLMGPGSTQQIMNLIGFDQNSIQARGKLKSDIKRKLKLPGVSPAIQYAEELGQWIATGKRGGLANAYTNAYSIAFDHMEEPSEERTNLLDAYATLASLDHLDDRQVSLVKNLSTNEFNADASNNGMIDLLDTHIVYKTKSRKDLFSGDPIQMVKGYIVERMDNLTSIKLGPASDKEKMNGLGYKHEYPLGKVDKDQTHDTLYINRNIPEVADISGVMSTTNQRNAGTTLTEILMRNPAYQYPNTKKPNFRKISAKIDQVKKEQARLAKQLKHDPRFSKFTPIRDTNNRITDYRVMMDHAATKEIIRPDLEFQNVFAHMQSRLVDRVNSIGNDVQTINLLVHEQADLLQNHKDQFVNLLDEKSAYIERYRKLPRIIRDYIQKFAIDGKFMVREDIIDKVFGYKQLDITQLKLLQGEGYGTQKTKQMAGLAHHLIRETVGYGKNRVVLAIPQVIVGNLFSNVTQLAMRKIPMEYIFYKIIEGIQEYRKYSKDNKELAKLKHLIETKRLNPKTSPEALQAARLKVRIEKNKLHKMSKAGLNSLIVEDINEAQIDGYFNRMKRVLFKGKFKHIGDRIPRSVQGIASTLFFAKGSIPYEMSRQLVQMTDFLGRYVMIEHAVHVKGRNFKDAMHEALDAFVLFDEALLPALEALDAVGVTSFLSYFLRNQRAVNQVVKANPSTVGISALVQHMTGVPTLGNINSAWLGGDFSPNLFQFDDLFDEANNITGVEFVSEFTKMLN
ncbi:hypothetical protein OAW27_00190 [bacterium]|nr:hypothetical protein [bacterium]